MNEGGTENIPSSAPTSMDRLRGAEQMDDVAVKKLEKQRTALAAELRDLSVLLPDLGSTSIQTAMKQIRNIKKSHTIARRSARACELSAKVFAIPELVEQILFYLHNRDLLKAYSVNRTFEQVIKGSLKLQRKLGLTVHEHVEPYLTGNFMPCWKFRLALRITRYEEDDENNESENGGEHEIQELYATLEVVLRKPLRNLGSRCSSMLLCQPPLQLLQVTSECCDEDEQLVTVAAKEATEGITVNDLNEALRQLWPEHVNCINADVLMHNTDGTVRPGFSAEGQIDVDISQAWVKEREARERERAERSSAPHRKLQPFIDAKQKAHLTGQPIPTLIEYQAQQLKAAEANEVEEGNVGD